MDVDDVYLVLDDVGAVHAYPTYDAAVAAHPEFALFQPLRFPLMYVDKPAMWGIAKQHGYDHLLRRTWSCWYPTAAGKPCNKCLMCRERIVKTG